METPTIEKLVKIYMKMKAAHSELEAQAEAVKKQQDEVKNAIKDMMQAEGVLSSKTSFGTVSLSLKKRYYTHDWDSFKQFVMTNDALDLFEKRIAQRNMAQFLEANPTLVPPGLDSISEYEVSVRKPSA